MTSSFLPASRTSMVVQFPKTLWVILIISAPGTVFLTLRLIYEKTLLTWKLGPVLVGFALAHVGPIIFLGVSIALALIWFLTSLVWLLVKTIKKRAVSRKFLRVFTSLFFILLLYMVPYGIWQSITIVILGPSDHGKELLTFFAATGSTTAVRTVLHSGIDVDSKDSDGKTALMAASINGQDAMVEYLVRRGADINAKTEDGKSAIDYAIETAHSHTAEILREYGARSQYY